MLRHFDIFHSKFNFDIHDEILQAWSFSSPAILWLLRNLITFIEFWFDYLLSELINEIVINILNSIVFDNNYWFFWVVKNAFEYILSYYVAVYDFEKLIHESSKDVVDEAVTSEYLCAIK